MIAIPVWFARHWSGKDFLFNFQVVIKLSPLKIDWVVLQFLTTDRMKYDVASAVQSIKKKKKERKKEKNGWL